MDAGIKETKEQALKEMELFKTVFDGVRLLNMHALELIGKGLVPIPFYRIGAEV